MTSMPKPNSIKGPEKRKRAKNDDGSTQQKKRKHKSVDQEDSSSFRSSNGVAPNSELENGDNPEGTWSTTATETRLNGDVPDTRRKHLVKHTFQKWKISGPTGGRMSDVDPIFTADEKFLLITYDTSVQVYSIADSLLVRRISLPVVGANRGAPYLVATALSQVSPNLVWVAASDGRIWRVDWTTGSGSDGCFQTRSQAIVDITVEAVRVAKTSSEIIFVAENKGDLSKIVAYDPTDISNPRSQELQDQTKALSILRSSHEGRVLVGAGKDELTIGILKTNGLRRIEDLTYNFYSVATSDDICSLTLRCAHRKQSLKKKKPTGSNNAVLDVVVGGARGSILLYEDVLSQLQGNTHSKPPRGHLMSQKKHWHRRAVHSVAWSEDGNYLISGGSEAVLVLWQLDTGKQSFLPHLAGSIENVVVSPSGSSYAVHLDNNSTMVLSTADMKPITYVSGLQSLVFGSKKPKDSFVQRVSEAVETINAPVPAAINPKTPSQMLLCVGSSREATHSGSLPITPLLQWFDLDSLQSMSKQPLTRTNATEVRHSSQGYPILEPRTSQMAISCDGTWLATIDEWEPPERDVSAVTEGSVNAADYCRERREIYLKFWEVKEDGTSLELSTRIDGPHTTHQSEDVFDIAADNVSTRFATIGDDGCVRLWAPRQRQRDGLAVSGPTGQPLVSWSCSRTISLGESIKSQDELMPLEGRAASKRSGALTFSEDGSILFGAYGYYDEVVVYIIDTGTGEIRHSLHDMCRGAVRDLQLLNSCLLILSDDLAIYDLVKDELHYGIKLGDTYGPASSMTLLAVDRKSQCFALAVPNMMANCGTLTKGAVSELGIFSLDNCEPYIMKKMPHLITRVLPAGDSSGFTVIDSAAQIWSVVEGTGAAVVARPLVELGLDETTAADAAEQTKAVILNGDDPVGSDDEQEDAMDVDVDTADDDDVHAAVVAPQRLAEIFDAAPAFAMPPIEDIFYQVAGLFAPKPLSASTA